MPDQTIKHNNAPPDFLLILIPAAFLAVVLATAWKLILGFTLLLTGNSVWQSYQWTKLAQQVDPAFSRLVVEQKGEVSPLELSARAKIAPAVANRYLNNKAVDLGGVSYQAPNGSPVYSFLTVGTLASSFVDIEPNASLYQKLAELEPAPGTELVQFPAVSGTPAIEPPPVTVTVAPPVPEVSQKIEEVLEQAVAPPIPPAPPMGEVASQPQKTSAKVKAQPKPAPPATEPTEASDFTQALRNIFNNPPASAPEEPMVVEPAAEPLAEVAAASALEIISQADLAKRLDVHASTIYKRRSDVSFEDWTRNRDPEGVAWGYSRETKEFHRIG